MLASSVPVGITEMKRILAHSKVRSSRLSQPNLANLISNNCERRSRMSQPSLCSTSLVSDLETTEISFSVLDNHRLTNLKKYQFDLPIRPYRRERLSQPTLVTGDFYPKNRIHQRLSHPSLGFASKEFPASLRSPIFIRDKRFSLAPSVSPTTRNHISSIDFGTVCYRAQMQLNKFNRDRFSIPELETENDLKQIVGTVKQRYSLDSQLNHKPTLTTSRVFSLVKSPILENTKQRSNEEFENALFASAVPLYTSSILNATKYRERLSVPEIRNATLKRLMDATSMVQRHSITDSISEEPRHYAYIYETNKSKSINKSANICKISLPKKKYLESNFDENERVITTVIETEVPLILSSPKYMKKTHAYSTEPPKWMMKYLDIDNEDKVIQKNDVNSSLCINISNHYNLMNSGSMEIKYNRSDTTYEESTIKKHDSDSVTNISTHV